MPATTKYPIIDGHNDALMYFSPVGKSKVASFFKRTKGRQLDLPSAREGGLAAAIFAVFIEDESSHNMVHAFDTNTHYVLPALDTTYASQTAAAMSANLFRLEAQSEGQVKIVRNYADLQSCLKNDVFGAVLHFEGAEPIDKDLNALEIYYQAGLRSLGIVWSRPTIFAHGVPFIFPHSPDTGPGLTAAGKALVKACNHFGIMIDLSHLNEKGFWDVTKLSDAPLVATHSNAWELCKLPRNLTPKQLAAVKESDGLVGLNFVTLLAREDGRDDANTPLDVMVRHVDYLVEHLGIDRVGLGSDFGVATVPKDLSDVSKYPNLIEALRKAGYNHTELKKLTHENWMRVLKKTWK